jgi:hypothetical protein
MKHDTRKDEARFYNPRPDHVSGIWSSYEL